MGILSLMRFLMSKDCWAYCPLLESHFKGTLLYFYLNFPISWNKMKCAQVIESLSDLESLFLCNRQANLFCTITHGVLNGFGSPAAMSTQGPIQVLQSCKRNRGLYREWLMQDTACATWSGNTVVKSWAGVCIQAAPPSSTCRRGWFLPVRLWVISASALIPFGICFKDSHVLPDHSFESLLMCLWQLWVL